MNHPYGKSLLSWIAPEHPRHERGKIWRMVMASLVALSSFLSFILGAWSFGLAIITFSVAYYLVYRSEIPDITVTIHQMGIQVGKRRYPFSHIKAFWIIHEPPFVNKLYLQVQHGLLRDIPIELADQNPGAIREVLAEKLEEIKHQQESTSEVLIRLFKI